MYMKLIDIVSKKGDVTKAQIEIISKLHKITFLHYNFLLIFPFQNIITLFTNFFPL